MKRLSVLAILLMLGMASIGYADSVPMVVSATTNAVWTRTVFNDSGRTLQSGEVVRWDNDDPSTVAEFDDSGYPYVDVTTTLDDVWVAGVVAEGMICPDQTLCEIVVYGPTRTIVADATDPVAEDTLVATTSVSGQAGDYGPAANTCALGILTKNNGQARNNESDIVFVNISCQ